MAQQILPLRGFLIEFEDFCRARAVEELLASPVNFDEFVCNHEITSIYFERDVAASDRLIGISRGGFDGRRVGSEFSFLEQQEQNDECRGEDRAVA